MANTPAPQDDYASLFASKPIAPRNKYAEMIRENPLVPIFIAATGISLVGGFMAYRNGQQELSQKFQRGRVLFQGLTIVSLIVGTWNYGLKPKETAAPASGPSA